MTEETEKKKLGILNIQLLPKDGWNFGLGFFTAAFVFTFIIVPTIGCLVLIIVSLFSTVLTQLLIDLASR